MRMLVVVAGVVVVVVVVVMMMDVLLAGHKLHAAKTLPQMARHEQKPTNHQMN